MFAKVTYMVCGHSTLLSTFGEILDDAGLQL